MHLTFSGQRRLMMDEYRSSYTLFIKLVMSATVFTDANGNIKQLQSVIIIGVFYFEFNTGLGVVEYFMNIVGIFTCFSKF